MRSRTLRALAAADASDTGAGLPVDAGAGAVGAPSSAVLGVLAGQPNALVTIPPHAPSPPTTVDALLDALHDALTSFRRARAARDREAMDAAMQAYATATSWLRAVDPTFGETLARHGLDGLHRELLEEMLAAGAEPRGDLDDLAALKRSAEIRLPTDINEARALCARLLGTIAAVRTAATLYAEAPNVTPDERERWALIAKLLEHGGL